MATLAARIEAIARPLVGMTSSRNFVTVQK
jgi:hypothetical protein